MFDAESRRASAELLAICPGYDADATLATGPHAKQTAAEHEFGRALEIWEGYASDPEFRYRGSSGGLLSALALYCLEREKMAFVLHAAMDENKPWLNKTVASRSRDELLARTGSRYSPASPCEALGEIERSDRPCVFIGKPSDTMAAWKLRNIRPELDRNLGLVLSFFCAGEPSTLGTIDLLRVLGIPEREIDTVHYRGEGWPGSFRVKYDQQRKQKSLTYRESWSRLTKYRPFRWQLDPDGLGRVCDISCGDAWESFTADSDPGRSLAIVRTKRGQEILHRAMDAGYVTVSRVEPETVIAAQRNLLERRKEIFGRLLALRLLFVPVPRLSGFSLFNGWLSLSINRKLRTVLGTLRRVIQRGLWKRRTLSPAMRASSTEQSFEG